MPKRNADAEHAANDVTNVLENADKAELTRKSSLADTSVFCANIPLPDNGILTGGELEETVAKFELSSIKPVYNGKKPKIITGKLIVRMALLAACAGLFFYCVYAIAQRVADDIRNENIMEDLIEATERKSEVARTPRQKESPLTLTLFDALGVTEYAQEWNDIDTAGKYDSIRYTLTKLKAANSDIFGWIRCVGGMININYPIVKSTDNSFYLNKNFEKRPSVAGSIFADFRNSFTQGDNYNTIFYGHCMTNGTMFRAVKDWYDSPSRSAAADQINIEIITPDAVYVYEIFAAYRSSGSDFITVSFANNAEYLTFLKNLQKKSVLKKTTSFDINTRIITLSTCTNVISNPDERYVVHGKLVKIIKYS
ncbi:MAG: class B sortase [Eubacteriales bacterium]